MNLNREKLTCCIAVLFFVYGIYSVGTRFTSQGKDSPLPNITIRRAESKVFAPGQKPYLSSDEGGRNPFSFSEGWKDLDAASLPPPSIPDNARILPGLSGGIPLEDGGVNFSEERPKQVDAPSKRAPGTAPGVGPGATAGPGDAPDRGLLPPPGAGTKPATPGAGK
jgi:hypothetical protein